MLNKISQAWPQPLFTSVHMGKLQLPNRIIMAPLTRMRAANPGHAATELHTEYYAQRASAGLIIGECTEISPVQYVEPGRVGIKVGPMHLSGPFAANADTLPDMEYVVKKLNDYDLAHLLLMGPTTDFTGSPLEQLAGDGMFQHFRPLYQGHVIANVDMTQERGNRLIEAGLADSIAFGRPYIANPDLPVRFLTGAKLNEVGWPTVYASGPKGYTDYPTLMTAG